MYIKANLKLIAPLSDTCTCAHGSMLAQNATVGQN